MKSNRNPFSRSAPLAVTALAPDSSNKGKSFTTGSPASGFALVITLSLMILLTVIAVGLLTLSSVALRSSSQSRLDGNRAGQRPTWR